MALHHRSIGILRPGKKAKAGEQQDGKQRTQGRSHKKSLQSLVIGKRNKQAFGVLSLNPSPKGKGLLLYWPLPFREGVGGRLSVARAERQARGRWNWHVVPG